APGAMPYLARYKPGLRVADPSRAVVLESRGEARRRAGAIYGAVLVEAVPFPKSTVPGQPSALLQVWPEPRLQWEANGGTKVSKALDAGGGRLAAEFTPAGGSDVRRTADGMVLVR